MDTTSTVVHSLPRQTTSFIGREHEIADLLALLDNPDCQLLTLIGSEGYICQNVPTTCKNIGWTYPRLGAKCRIG